MDRLCLCSRTGHHLSRERVAIVGVLGVFLRGGNRGEGTASVSGRGVRGRCRQRDGCRACGGGGNRDDQRRIELSSVPYGAEKERRVGR